MRVIGTAGHVDHGKSTLIAALTGVHPDRLKEEREREMTIDLGFGWLVLPNGEEIGIVDVPGHRDFIENMLAGIGGIDAALLVIAADEGVMPQTREHLAILDLLQIPAGLIALTKTDLAPDPDWLELLEADVRAAVRGTVLADAPILRVSAKTKTGLDALAASLQSLLSEKPSRPDLNRPRLPIDRVFSMPGFGAVVTGTLTDGALALGDEVEILPSEQKGRVRGLQTHKKKEDRAAPGSRTAVNISGIAAEKIQRGEVVVRPNQYQPTRRVDARLRLLKDASAPLKHGAEVKVFLGAAETIAAVRVLGADELAPASEGWAQLELRDPLVAVRSDRLILRRPSPTETIGGGVIADPHPKGRHKRFDEATLNSLESLARGSPADVLLEAALALSPASAKEVMARSGLESEAAVSAMNELLANGTLVNLDGGEWRTDSLLMPASRWDALQDKTLQIVGEYHKAFPLRKGIPREELKSKLKLAPRVFNAGLALIANRKLVDENGAFVALPAHAVRLDAAQQVKVKALMRRFEADPSAPPSVKESQAEVGEEVYNALIEMGELTAVSQEVVFRSKDYAAMTEKVKSSIAQNGQTTLAEVRDLLSTTRKYAQALLEHLDAVGVTVRDGDARRLKR
ncbi:MAG: selenocysteine-specific translation elongation factor [Anaerolineae bacterium CFX3]|nr:selenocysteine-specific translation elongation factor [Anaerolineae bacterium CFX3]MCQ3946136.1 selenocysteine-specific translation elongation factor [Anaerolineae bacterium]RIK27555.1 MAG: selenocysteine-specific translation elongation factor [Anaerolineae bacterium]